MTLFKHLPNLLTLLNLLSGSIAVIYAVKDQLVTAAIFVFIGIVFDFLDGFAARILKVQGELGKQLDSLADVVTSGLVPGVVIYQLLLPEEQQGVLSNLKVGFWGTEDFNLLPFIGLLFTLAAAYRLAKFNIDDRQSNSFIGLPAPAASLVVLSLPLIIAYSPLAVVTDIVQQNWFLIVLTVILSLLMHVEVPLFALKFKDYSWKNNNVKYVFIVLTALLCAVFQYVAIPLVIILYVLTSLLTNRKKSFE